jgi:hypothetical protein
MGLLARRLCLYWLTQQNKIQFASVVWWVIPVILAGFAMLVHVNYGSRWKQFSTYGSTHSYVYAITLLQLNNAQLTELTKVWGGKLCIDPVICSACMDIGICSFLC